MFKMSLHVMMIAKESAAWSLVSRPTYCGGPGFNYEWGTDWIDDILRHTLPGPIYRKYNYDNLTLSFMYASSEDFTLPISHNKVVHGKYSLINKMSDDNDEKLAGMRAFMSYMIAHPGKRLIPMGMESCQSTERNNGKQSEWFLLECPLHQQA